MDKIRGKGDENNDRKSIDFHINFGTNFGMILDAKTAIKYDGKSIECLIDFYMAFL